MVHMVSGWVCILNIGRVLGGGYNRVKHIDPFLVVNEQLVRSLLIEIIEIFYGPPVGCTYNVTRADSDHATSIFVIHLRISRIVLSPKPCIQPRLKNLSTTGWPW